jgi:hypothetical protein
VLSDFGAALKATGDSRVLLELDNILMQSDHMNDSIAFFTDAFLFLGNIVASPVAPLQQAF